MCSFLPASWDDHSCKESLHFLVTMGLRKQKQRGDKEKFPLEFFSESGEELVTSSSNPGRWTSISTSDDETRIGQPRFRRISNGGSAFSVSKAPLLERKALLV